MRGRIHSLSSAVLVVLVLSLGAVFPVSTNAAIGPGCDLFFYQEDAQYAYDRTRADYPDLFDQSANNTDSDGNGRACEELPSTPALHEFQISGRGNFDSGDNSDRTFRLSTYSLFVSAEIAGVDLSSATCTDLLADDTLNSIVVPEGERVRPAILGTNVEVIEGEGPTKVTALIWLPLDDPQNPLLFNVWMLSQGLGRLDASSAPEEYSEQLQQAEESAKSSKLGIWGNCQVPAPLTSDAINPYQPMVQASGNGDQIVSFSVITPGTYVLTLNAGSGDVVLYFVDIYDVSGNQVYELSISSGESGSYTSAGYLPVGDYYVQIKAVGSWKVTIEPVPALTIKSRDLKPARGVVEINASLAF